MDDPEVGQQCTECEKRFHTRLQMKYHTCTPQFKYACTKCSFHGLSFDELLTHVKESHSKCKSCDYISDTKDDLINHNQVIHKILKVDLGAKDRIEMQCDECQYKCLLNIHLKKHKKAVHEVQENDLKYNCEKCAFATNYLLHLWEHREQKHPDQTPTFHPRSKDMALALLAEQNIDLIEELESFKKGIKGAFLEFADDIFYLFCP